MQVSALQFMQKLCLPLILSAFSLILVSISSLQGKSISDPTSSSVLCYPERLVILITAWRAVTKQDNIQIMLLTSVNSHCSYEKPNIWGILQQFWLKILLEDENRKGDNSEK